MASWTFEKNNQNLSKTCVKHKKAIAKHQLLIENIRQIYMKKNDRKQKKYYVKPQLFIEDIRKPI